MIKKLNCIMLVDDDEDDNFFHETEIIENHLASTVLVEDSGKKALDYLKSSKEPHCDLIFLDINMPGMSGWEFLDEYNKLDGELQRRAMIFMLSTSENPADAERAKNWSFVSDYITKPLTKEVIVGIISKYFN